MSDETPDTPQEDPFAALMAGFLGDIDAARDHGPQEPPSDLRQAAAALFEMYVAFIQAGFTEPQALHLVAVMLGNSGGRR